MARSGQLLSQRRRDVYVRVTDLHVVCVPLQLEPSPDSIVCGVDTPPHPPGKGSSVMSPSWDARSLLLLIKSQNACFRLLPLSHLTRHAHALQTLGAGRQARSARLDSPSQSIATAGNSKTVSATTPAMIVRSMCLDRGNMWQVSRPSLHHLASVMESTAPIVGWNGCNTVLVKC